MIFASSTWRSMARRLGVSAVFGKESAVGEVAMELLENLLYDNRIFSKVRCDSLKSGSTHQATAWKYSPSKPAMAATTRPVSADSPSTKAARSSHRAGFQSMRPSRSARLSRAGFKAMPQGFTRTLDQLADCLAKA